MNFSMEFYDPKDAAEDYCVYISHIYRITAQGARAAPSAEEVFPSLCQFAKARGLAEPIEFALSGPAYYEMQVAKLCGCVYFVFRVAPHLAADLIKADAPPGSYPSGNTADTVLPTASSKPATPVPAVGSVNRKVDVSDSTALPTKNLSDGEKNKISPYRIEQELTRRETIRIIGEALFVYSCSYYAHISAECLRRLIMRDCRQAVEAVGTSRLIDEVYKLLLCDPDLFRQEEDIHSHLVAFDNGVLDLLSGRLFPASPDFNIFYCLNTWWGNRAPHPYFDAFLEDVTGGDELLKQRILEVIGYCLVPDVQKKLFFVFQGHPDTGKSLLAKFIRACINPDACIGLDITTLGDRFAAANLVGKQLCLSMDIPVTPLNSRMVATFKSVTGGDPITADVKYCPHISFFNRAKFILGSNHPLLIQGDDPAFYLRAVAIPFEHSIPPERQDPDLLDRLNEERAAIVYDAIQAYRRLRDRNYVFSGDFPVNGMFRSGSSIPQSAEVMVQDFVLNHCVIAPDAMVFVDELYARFCDFYPAASVNENWFGAKVLDACKILGSCDVHRGTKRRKEGRPNPQANLIGLYLKEEK